MPETTRQLAAILFSDIVGYTSLMGKDSDKALDLIRTSMGIQKPLVEKHNGKWLKEMGDGVMAQFGSAIDAVKCAIDIQKKARAELDAKLRIGIHLGDITIENNDIYGDGVNVASRLESITDPGGIYISESIMKAINGQGIDAVDIGEQNLKNVSYPVKTYAVQGVGLPVPSKRAKIKKGIAKKYYSILIIVFAGILALAGFYYAFSDNSEPIILDKSIAVMPFDNESSDEENQYFVNGMMEDVRNDLAKIGGLRVISKTSTEKYRGTSLSSIEIGKELSISYLLEGTVQKIGSQVKIHAQLISTSNDDHIWQDTYVKDISDIKEVFKIQSEIASTIAAELEVVVTPGERALIITIPTANKDAYDYYLKGRHSRVKYILMQKMEDYEEAMVYFDKALALDNNFSMALAEVANLIFNKEGREDAFFEDNFLDTVRVLANRAIEIDKQNALAYITKGGYYLWRGEYVSARENTEIGLKLDPNAAIGYFTLARIASQEGDYEDAFINLKRAEKLEKGSLVIPIYRFLANTYMLIGDYDKSELYAEKALDIEETVLLYGHLLWRSTVLGQFDNRLKYAGEALELNPNHYSVIIEYAQALDYLGRYREAEEYWETGLRKMEEQEGIMLNTTHRYAYHLWMMGDKEEAMVYFEKQIEYCNQMLNTGRSGGAANYDLAAVYAFLGNTEKVAGLLENYIGGVLVDFARVDPLFESLWEDKEFNEILENAQIERNKLRNRIEQLEENEF